MACPGTRFRESPCGCQGSQIVVKLLGGLGGEVVEVLVRPFGVEPVDPVQGVDLDVLDVAPGALPTDELVLVVCPNLYEVARGGSQRVRQRLEAAQQWQS